MRVPEEIISAIRKERSFLIATHINPDGDALGSALALAFALEEMGKEIFVFDRDPVPEFYRFLPGFERFRQDIPEDVVRDAVLILLDCNGPDRASLEGFAFRKSIVIDHHETESSFGDFRWIDRSAAATGLLVFALIKELGITPSPDIATNLYAALSVDTGTFRYSNTSAGVFRVAAELVDRGAEPHVVADHLYERWSERRFRLLIETLKTLEIHDGIGLIHVTGGMFSQAGASPEDTENFSNFPRMIDSVRLAAFFRAAGEKTWKVSLRSKGEVNVAAVAERFGGGGHRNAAGYRIQADLEKAKKALLDACLNPRER